MKKLLFISTLLLLGFSCKKEKLKNEKEVFIGKWELEYVLEDFFYVKYGHHTFYDTLIPGVNAPTTFLTFKKKGLLTKEENGEEERFKINFKNKLSDKDGYSSYNDAYFKTTKETGSVFWDDTTRYFKDVYSFLANFHLKNNSVSTIKGIVNQDMLMLKTSGGTISSTRLSYVQGTSKNFFINELNNKTRLLIISKE